MRYEEEVNTYKIFRNGACGIAVAVGLYLAGNVLYDNVFKNYKVYDIKAIDLRDSGKCDKLEDCYVIAGEEK